MLRSIKSNWAPRIALCAIATLAVQAANADDERPNVIVILSDDQGWGDLSVHGNVNLATPNIDSLARDGALFDRFFVCPVCSPTRAEFLTGRYHPRGGVYSTSTGGERLDLDEMTIGQTFKASGYATAAFGKWHNGMQYPYHPNGRGFDEYYGFCSGHWGHYYSPMLEHNGQLVTGNGFIIDDFTDHAIGFIEENKDQPFFCYLPFNTPHSPMQVPASFYKKFDGLEPSMLSRFGDQEDLQMTRAALAMCENIDWNVGRILARLDELKLADNTIVVYFADNGPNSYRWNDGMRGRKGSTDEGGVRSPLLVRWPGHIEAGTKIEPIAAAIDLLPTLADLAGIPVASTKPLDGRSVKPLLMGKGDDWAERMIFSHWSGKVSVRTQQFRLDFNGQLFDMHADPGQDHDVAAEKPDLAKRLRNAVAKWSAEMLPGLSDDDRPFPIGHPEFRTSQIPARDGVPHGNVERSSKAPNCSYFTNWTSTEDSMTWDIDVVTSGDYEAVIYYTCPAENVGATIELSLGDARLAGKVAEVNDPPLVGAEQDYFPRRSESYVKDFKPLNLGTLSLDKGRGQLTLRALDIPGKGVIDVRLMLLTLK